MFFKTTDELTPYLDANSTLKLNELKPTIEFVENKLLIDVMGRAFYKEILEKYTQATEANPLSERETELLHFIRMMIAPYAVYFYAVKSLQLSGNGLQRVESDNAKTAFAYQKEEFREQFLLEAEQATENLIAFLFENAKEFETYSSANEFKDLKKLFISSGKEFGELYSNPQPNRLYNAVKSFMLDVEWLIIKKAIHPDLYHALKEKSKEAEPDFTEEETTALQYIKKAIAYFTLAKGLPHINVRIGANGITLVSDSTGGVRDMDKRKAADQQYVSHLIEVCQSSGSAYLKEAIDYIESNPSEFEKYKRATPLTYKPNNDQFSGVFGLI